MAEFSTTTRDIRQHNRASVKRFAWCRCGLASQPSGSIRQLEPHGHFDLGLDCETPDAGGENSHCAPVSTRRHPAAESRMIVSSSRSGHDRGIHSHRKQHQSFPDVADVRRADKPSRGSSDSQGGLRGGFAFGSRRVPARRGGSVVTALGSGCGLRCRHYGRCGGDWSDGLRRWLRDDRFFHRWQCDGLFRDDRLNRWRGMNWSEHLLDHPLG